MTFKTHDLGVSTNVEVMDRFLEFKGKFIVDAGCGDMNLSREMAARGASVLAIDPDPIQAEKNRQAETIANVGFAETGAQDIPVESRSIDGVVFPYSLHHVPAELFEAVFNEVKRILKFDGFLYIIEPVASGTLNEVTRLFHDESVVRQAAQQAIDTYALPAFSDAHVIHYRVPVTFRSWNDFVANYIAKTFNTSYSEDDVKSDPVHERFVALGQSTGFTFDSILKVTFLTGSVGTDHA
jgi:ubiquinone/menaquinone biosynthesis C-methylase UbiE